MGKEKIFEKEIKKYLQTKGIYPLGFEKQKMLIDPIGYYEKRFANRNTGSGLPDMHIVINGISLEVEIKAENGTPSDLQLKICDQIRESEAYAIVLYPSGFEKFKTMIDNIIDFPNLKLWYPLLMKGDKNSGNK